MTTAASYSSLVQELYVAYFGRPADYYGLQNFETALAAANAPTDPAALALAYSTNAAVKSLVDSFGTSAESTALYGSGSTESFVNAIFENLFGRPAAVSGLTFWVNAIESGAVSQGDAALAILAGSEPTSNSSSQATADWALVQAKVAVATSFTTALGASSTQIVDYSGATAAQDARLMLSGVTAANAATFDVQTTINDIVAGNTQNTFNLTTGVDTFTGGTGNNTFNAILDNTAGLAAGGQAATLQSFDTITGGTLNNTLNITDFGLGSQMTIPGAAAITGITTVNISSLEGIGSSYGTPLDFTTLGSGVTNVNINASSGDDYVKVGNTTALVLTDTADEDIYTWGGSTVTVNNNPTAGSYGNYIEVQGGAATTSVTLNNGYDEENYIYDLNEGTSKTNTLATVSINNQVDYDTYIYSNALTQLNLTDISYHYVYDYGTTGTRALNVALNGDGTASGYSGDYWYLETDAATLNVTTSGAASVNAYFYAPDATAITFTDAVGLSFYEGASAGSDYFEAAAAKSVTISGAGAFTADLSGVNAAAVINASGSSGVITVEMNSAGGQSFTGGTGQDIVTVGAAQSGVITAGSATDNEIILANAVAATQADLATYTHFSILGVSGTTSGVFDMSKLANGSGYTSFDVQGSGGAVTFTNAATDSSLSLEGGNSHIITLQTIDTTGATDSVNLSLGTTTSDGNTYSQVTVEDSNFVGTATVNLTANTLHSGSANTLTTLGDTNLITLNIAGTGTVNIGTISTHSTSVTINNDAVNNSDVSNYISTLSDNYLSTLTFGGSEGIYVNALSSTSASLTITDNDASSLVFGTLADSALTSATFTNSVNTTAAVFHIETALSEAGLATLNLNGNVQVSVNGDTVTSGITVAGATDNANVLLNFSTAATAAGKTDSVALGNGNDSVQLGAGVGIGGGTPAVPGATEQVTVTWADMTTGGFETIGGITVTTAGAESAANIADAVTAILGGGTWTGVGLSTTGAYTVSGLSGDTTVLTAASSGVMADPASSATNTAGSAPTDTVTTVGTAGSPAIPGSTTASNHIVTLGTGTDAVTDTTAGSTTISITGSSTSSDAVVANSAQTVHITLGNGTDVIAATATGASINISVGTGVNTIVVGADTTGTISLGAHTGTDAIGLGASGTSLTAIEKISGLNNATTDTLTFSGDISASLTGFTQVTAGAVVGSGGDTTLLADWVAAADGLDAKVAGAAHSVTWFQYQGNTYLLESVAGATADAGTMVAGNTLVELTGTGYTFAHTTGAGGGTLHLLG